METVFMESAKLAKINYLYHSLPLPSPWRCNQHPGRNLSEGYAMGAFGTGCTHQEVDTQVAQSIMDVDPWKNPMGNVREVIPLRFYCGAKWTELPAAFTV